MRRQTDFFKGVAITGLLFVAACAVSPENGSSRQTEHQLSRDEMFGLLADRDTAECVGSLEFMTDRRFEGESSCGRGFRGHSDASLEPGTVCVYSSTFQSRGATDFIATGHFFCSDKSRGSVRFQEQVGNGPGTATVSTDDGRIVTLNYE